MTEQESAVDTNLPKSQLNEDELKEVDEMSKKMKKFLPVFNDDVVLLFIQCPLHLLF